MPGTVTGGTGARTSQAQVAGETQKAVGYDRRMQRPDYERFTAHLRERLAADGRVVGLVALGSMSGEPPEPDEWSDHDFFVISRPGEQEGLRTELSWLPDAEEIAFSFRETAHGLKVLYRSGHLLELAVFDLEELSVAAVAR